MKKMANFLSLNYGWLILAAAGLFLVVYSVARLQKPIPLVPTTKSVNFTTDSIVSTPVMANNPWANVFHDAAVAAIEKKTNPWVYLSENWEKAKKFKGVEPALLDFIQKEAGRKIPENSTITLSIRDYSNENSVVMEYRDPVKDSVMVATGHDPEPALYATFANKTDSVTFKLICANGLVRELGGKVTNFDQDYLIKEGDSFIGITGCTTQQASKFAGENNLPVRFILEGMVESKTPDFSKTKVFKDFAQKKSGIFDVVIQPGNVLRKENGKYLYINK